jgi:hypothetical protein
LVLFYVSTCDFDFLQDCLYFYFLCVDLFLLNFEVLTENRYTLLGLLQLEETAFITHREVNELFVVFV